jgi:prepilin-type N-terminal cleavage/methylation domain-containing protein
MPEGPPAAAFSLLEMMTVLSLLLIFASFALPTYQNIVIRTREAALRDDLYTTRSMIDRFTLDNRRAPASPQDLVEAGTSESPQSRCSRYPRALALAHPKPKIADLASRVPAPPAPAA